MVHTNDKHHHWAVVEICCHYKRLVEEAMKLKTNQVALLLLLLCALVALPSAHAQQKPPYLDPSLPVGQRVEDLLERMTLEEKVGQMNQYIAPRYARASGYRDAIHSQDNLLDSGLIGSFLFVSDVEEANELQKIAEGTRLGIPLLFGIDAVHGLCPVRGATVFPVPLAMAGSFDLGLVERSSRITARETRASGMHWAFYPVLGVGREPRWGRTPETFGEDTYLVTEMGLAVVRGFQGDGLSSPENVIACVKHFAAHSQPLGGRNTAPMEISERTMRSVFLPPFEAAIRAGALSVMPAYHENNGIPSHTSKWLLSDILRKEWGFEGFVVSDWGAIERLVNPHRTAPDMKEAVRQAVTAGVDMHMHGDGFTEPMLELLDEGTVALDRLDDSVRRILMAKMKLGLFDNRYVDPALAARTLAAPEHVKEALEAARKSIVLLENRDNLLPLSKSIKNVLVTGPAADNNALLGDWSAPQPAENVTTVLEGIRASVSQFTTVKYVESGIITEISQQQIDAAAAAARGADVAVVVVGGNDTRYDSEGNRGKSRPERTGGEGIDRANLQLMGRQLDLVQAIHATGTPTVVVLINGRPLAVEWIARNVPAVLEAWQPGMVGGQAVAEVLFGDVNPSGKLAISIPKSVGQLPVYYNHPASMESEYKYSD